MFSFSIIIPVKNFELTLNSKSLHLYRQKSGGGGRFSSIATIIMFWNTADDIVPCTLNALHLYRHKSRGGGTVRSTAEVQTRYCSDTQRMILYRVHFTLYTCSSISRGGGGGQVHKTVQ